MPSRNNRQRKNRLFYTHPYCYWCNIKLVHPKDCDDKNQPANMATLDHLDDRYSEQRGTQPGQVRTVLACNKCNCIRSVVSTRRQSIKKLWIRSGSKFTKTFLISMYWWLKAWKMYFKWQFRLLLKIAENDGRPHF